ncbi:aminoglycoside phosphotransferase family protein [Sphingomicrobium aestuariivivum]|uniref:aminoglycoside phosphotransferase family protein n=1 Tax=Sphingomicrobium aestuariivivum TaxID=1582356 RepID=UPI001FD6412B|nr:phosphotransferase [Sphingomicrobium aestuariivivum]MCJ8189950.1 phosphotransferase [Sphingomicrobium aestuariivivum]
MTPPTLAPAFLDAAGWGGAEILPLAGDASFRRYFRVVHPDHGRAVLMDAPPEHEDSRPFIAIAEHLDAQGLRAPRILHRDLEAGLLLLEDFGDKRVAPVLAAGEGDEGAIYAEAVDTLVQLHEAPLPAGVAPYDEDALKREVDLFVDWYLPALGVENIDRDSFDAAWKAVWPGLLARTAAHPVLVLRDYHADNLMLLEEGGLGLLDFQDALAGHAGYDLVSLLQDARRDVDPSLEARMRERFITRSGIEHAATFIADYELLGAQRNVKILGIFTRLWKRDGKPHYLKFQPRMWGLVERNLAHPSLAPLKAWFDANVPPALRADAWEEYR